MNGPAAARIRRFLRAAAPVAALIGCALLLSGCDASQPQTTFYPRSDVAWDIQNLFVLTIVAGLAVVIPVEIFLVYAVLRYRRRPGQDPGPPVGRHGSTPVEIIWTIIPVLILVVIAIPTVQIIFKTAEAAPKSAVNIKVIAHQWWWEYRYFPNTKQEFTTANQLHLPVGRQANFLLDSADVIHSFWLPGLDGKRDVFANHENVLTFTPSATGVYPGQCAEFCGPSHAFMGLEAVVESPAQFDAWVRDQQKPAVLPANASALVRRGAVVFGQAPCAGCHTIAGMGASGTVGPNLTHVGSRTRIAGELLANTPSNMAQWILDSPSFKPGSYMPPQHLNKADLAAVVAYLESLK